MAYSSSVFGSGAALNQADRPQAGNPGYTYPAMFDSFISADQAEPQRADSPQRSDSDTTIRPTPPTYNICDLHFPCRLSYRRPGIALHNIIVLAETGWFDRPFDFVIEHGRQHFEICCHGSLPELMRMNEDKDMMALTGVVAALAAALYQRNVGEIALVIAKLPKPGTGPTRKSLWMPPQLVEGLAEPLPPSLHSLPLMYGSRPAMHPFGAQQLLSDIHVSGSQQRDNIHRTQHLAGPLASHTVPPRILQRPSQDSVAPRPSTSIPQLQRLLQPAHPSPPLPPQPRTRLGRLLEWSQQAAHHMRPVYRYQVTVHGLRVRSHALSSPEDTVNMDDIGMTGPYHATVKESLNSMYVALKARYKEACSLGKEVYADRRNRLVLMDCTNETGGEFNDQSKHAKTEYSDLEFHFDPGFVRPSKRRYYAKKRMQDCEWGVAMTKQLGTPWTYLNDEAIQALGSLGDSLRS